MAFIDKYHRHLAALIAVLSFGCALFYNEVNLHELISHTPPLHKVEPKYNWIQTPDDAAYLRPAENYYYNHVWKDNNPGKQSYFLRTPGYGLFRYILMRIMGFDNSYYYFWCIQLFLFAISVLLLYKTAEMVGLPRGYALTIQAIYGLSPFAIGFLYYSITEGITPALMIAYVFFLLLAYRRSGPFFFILAAIVMAYIGITRPVLLLFAAALPLMIWWRLSGLDRWRRLVFIVLTSVIVTAPIGIWSYRNQQIAGASASIYPIYYAENNSQFRPTHGAIWDFTKSYGTEGKDFHEVMVPLWRATIAGDTSDVHIDSIMMACPDFVKQTIGDQKLRASYVRYRQSIIYQRTTYPKDTVMPDTIPAIEREVIKDFKAYAAQINSAHWSWCHIIVPLRLFKTASFHSNLSLYIFQHTFRGQWWMEILRSAFLLIHLLCCLSFLYILVFARDRAIRLLYGCLIGVYFFYLCYFFRGLEERYTLPLLPLMLVGLFYCLHDLKIRWADKSFNKKGADLH
ncbi:MAG: hypothetical protein JWO03_1222 [Bacteroidetes bacterium]|nr:hypothetical protein [Bacteroidota bacterium]